MGKRLVPAIALSFLMASAVGACGRTELEEGPWHNYARPDVEPDVPDVEPDVPDVEEEAEVEPEIEEDEVEPDEVPDIPDIPDVEEDVEFTGLSCMSAAMCAICCGGDTACMLGCVNEVNPSERAALMSIVTCAMTTGCGMDFACLMDSCQDQFAQCDGGPGGTGGCLSLAWCLVSTGCQSVTGCADQGACYQGCFGAAQPEVIGVARGLLACVVGDCMTACAGGLTTTNCIMCLATNCLPALQACIAFPVKSDGAGESAGGIP